ncbi:MAG TPA: hypothetical protein VNT22_08840 [Baekduia sp.]|nr:hypothetical protein [Baekduia sp.]
MRAAPRHLPAIALGLLVVATVVGFFYYPTYPNYDSYYSLIWGREILHGQLPSFDSYRTPTQHPLAVGFGALLSLFGQVGDRILVACTLGSFVALCAGMYRLGKAVFTPLVGFAAAAILVTRFDFPFLAARGYIDIPFLAFVIWAAALEYERPRRQGIVWVFLLAAGMLRPEAWLLLGLYWLWLSVADGVTWGQRVRFAAIASIAPLIWVASDFIATGAPLFSLQHTSGLAEELGRAKGIGAVPSSLKEFFLSLAKLPVVLAGIAGAVVVSFMAPKRLAMPLVLWLVGVGTFVLVGIAGLSVIDRYLLVPAMMTMLFAAVTLGGWTMLEPHTAGRHIWAGAAALVLVFGIGFTVTRVTVKNFQIELTQRADQHDTLVEILNNPKVQAGQRCGPISVPIHKLVPDVRWITGGGVDDVIARSDPSRAKDDEYGVALVATSRLALLRLAIVDNSDDVFKSIPPDGFIRVGGSADYGAYVRCRPGEAQK